MSDSSESEFEDLAAAIKSFDDDSNASGDDSDNDSEKKTSDEDSEDEVKEIKRRKLINPEEEKKLDKFLFGDKEGLIKNLEGNSLFFTDVIGSRAEGSKDIKQPVWHDSDDEDFKKSTIDGDIKSKRKFERIANNPSWARLDKPKKEEDSSDEDEISKSVGHIAKKTSEKSLPKSELAFKKLANINKATMNEGRITSLTFHPKSTVGIVAGLRGTVSLFAIDGLENKKIHSIKYEKFPIHCCKLDNDGEELIVGGNDNFYHTYNLLSGQKYRSRLPRELKVLKMFELSQCGKYMATIGEFGEVHLLHAVTKELLCTLKQEYQSTSISFSKDSHKLFSHSDDNEVTIFDLRKQRIEHRFVDDGCVNGTSLTISDNGKLLATGSRQGFVNIYNYEDVFAKKLPQPLKAISNLTTEVTDLKFNPTTEMLAMCSSDANNALKIVHFPSATVFNNFPTQNTTLGKPTVLAFSPLSGFLGAGTVEGYAPLYRMRHFSNY